MAKMAIARAATIRSAYGEAARFRNVTRSPAAQSLANQLQKLGPVTAGHHGDRGHAARLNNPQERPAVEKSDGRVIGFAQKAYCPPTCGRRRVSSA